MESNVTTAECPPSVRPSGNIAFYMPVALLCLATITVNLLCLTTFIRFRRLRQKNNNLLIMSMNFADLLVAIVTAVIGTVLLQHKNTDFSTTTTYILGPICVAILISGLNLIIMSVDRLVAVTKPLKYHNLLPRERLVKLIVFVWLLPVILGALSLILSSTTLVSSLFLYASVIAITFLIFIVLAVSNAVLFRCSKKASRIVKPIVTSLIKDSIQNDSNGTMMCRGESFLEAHSSNESIASNWKSSITLHSSSLLIKDPFCVQLPESESVGSVYPSLQDDNNNKNNINSNNSVVYRSDDTRKERGLQRSHSTNDKSLLKLPSKLPPLRMRSSTTSCLDEAAATAISRSGSGILKRPSFQKSVVKRWRRRQAKWNYKSATCYICLLFTAIYLSCMVPVTVHLLGVISDVWCSSAGAFQAFGSLPLLNSFINPLLYFFKRKDFRKHLRKMIRGVLKW